IVPDPFARGVVAAATTLRSLPPLLVVEVVAGDEDEPLAPPLLRAFGELGGGEGGLRVEVEMAVLFDVAAVEVGNSFGRAERNVDQERHGPLLAHVPAELHELGRDLRVAGEDLLEE